MLAYGKELRKYKGVGNTLQKWFSYCSGCLVNSVNSVISRKPMLAIDKYISFDTQFITEKKLYWIKKKQKKLWWAVYSYHNFRRKKGLPVNGQRTKTNASTARKLKAI
jgi:ribosomal protein S13